MWKILSEALLCHNWLGSGELMFLFVCMSLSLKVLNVSQQKYKPAKASQGFREILADSTKNPEWDFVDTRLSEP